MKNKELDNILDQVTSGIHSEQVDDQVVNDASARVWARLSESTTIAAAAASPAVAADHIEGCPDFQSLIPAYLAGELSEARSLLLVDHTHECIPCRRALKNAREGQVETVFPVRRKSQRKTGTYSLRPVVLRWGIA
ncbi:MAG TPA: zf-HC2 domain-containing protein, partial [Candidatus Udaeobacter sp.]|nr:zf-HC2 domain-containing protein [Candidatus Udaeobacter sp.]